MKKNIALLLLLLIIERVFAQQALLPEVPKKIEFAGISIKLDADAQKLIQKQVNSLLTPEDKYLANKLERIQWYFPIIERILEEEEVPEDFKYMAVAESSLLPDAVSTSNAVGLWQMKVATAQEVGLRVDKEIDERKNIHASTKAAALYLKRNNLIYRNWISSLLSYSLGAAGVSKIIPAQWSYANEVDFNAKTDRYLLKTIAHRIAFEYKINRLRESPYSFVEYKKTQGKTLHHIASMVNIDINELKKYNSWLLTRNIPTDKDYSVAILVPEENLEEIQAKLSRQSELSTNNTTYPILKRITVATASDGDAIFYEINGKKGILAKAGENIASLAKSGKITIPNFIHYNDMSDKDVVQEGEVYYLKKKNKKGAVPHHVVLTGQSLWEISQMYGIRMKNLLKFNRMNTVLNIQKGRIIYLQKKRPKNEGIEYLNSKDIDELEKIPIKEQDYSIEEKPLIKDARQPETTEKTIKTIKPSIPTVIMAEENTKKTSSLPREDDDIIVISDEDEVLSPNEAKNIYTNPVPKTPANNTTNSVSVSSLKTHTVDVGQTLYSIAREYNIPVKDLAEWNNISTQERIKVSQVLVIKQPKNTAIIDSKTLHIVKQSETLYSISKRYGVTTKQIQEWNGMTDQKIRLGQELLIK